MKLPYKILATFFLAQAALGSSGMTPQYLMQQQGQGMQQQGLQQTTLPAPQWMGQGPQGPTSPMQWPMMMSGPMQQFGQAPQMGGIGAGPQMGAGGLMGQQQGLNIPAVPQASPMTGIGTPPPQIQNQSRMPAGGNSIMGPPQSTPSQPPQAQERGSVGR